MEVVDCMTIESCTAGTPAEKLQKSAPANNDRTRRLFPEGIMIENSLGRKMRCDQPKSVILGSGACRRPLFRDLFRGADKEQQQIHRQGQQHENNPKRHCKF